MTGVERQRKYYSFRESFPARASNPRMIENGDLMLYGDDTLVLLQIVFYFLLLHAHLGHLAAIPKAWLKHWAGERSL